MNKHIRKTLFKTLLNAERATAKQHGFVIRIRNIPNKNSGMYANVKGVFHKDEKVIRITITGKPGRGRILNALYHEMRHLEHTVKGLFADYYHYDDTFLDTMCSSYDLRNIPDDFRLPSLRVAYLAELDCNRTARKKLKPYGVYWRVNYPWKETQTYVVLNHILTTCNIASVKLLHTIDCSENIMATIELFGEISRVVKILRLSGIKKDIPSFSKAKDELDKLINFWYYSNDQSDCNYG